MFAAFAAAMGIAASRQCPCPDIVSSPVKAAKRLLLPPEGAAYYQHHTYIYEVVT